MTVADLRPVAIMGGTFDPIHCGHLAVAEQAREQLDLAMVMFVPSGIPPHKGDQVVTSADHREGMVALAIAGNPWFRLSRLELERPGPSYAIDTVVAVADESAREGRPEPWFIMSVEALAGFPDWRRPDDILARCRVAIVPRCGALPPEHAWLSGRFAEREDRFAFLAEPNLGHASTDIRERAAIGRSIRYLVPDDVERYIVEHRLYAPSREGDVQHG